MLRRLGELMFGQGAWFEGRASELSVLLIEVVVLLLIGFGLWFWWGPKSEGSQFKNREADKRSSRGKAQGPDLLADARMSKSKPRSKPLALPGIRLEGAPHEILGISAHASPKEIQKAYRELMKRYHPDKVGRPGSREWKDAQHIAEVINLAKDTLLKKSV